MKTLYEIYHDEMGLNRAQFARLADLPVATVCSIEKGQNSLEAASVYTLCRLAVALNTPLSEFYSGNCVYAKNELVKLAACIDAALKNDLIK